MSNPDESTEGEFFEAIGVAVVIWQDVEGECARLFHHLLVSNNGPAAYATFYHIKNQSTRLELLNIGAKFLFILPEQSEFRNEWARLAGRIKEAFGLRNKIAHSMIDETMTPTAWKFELKPQSSDFGHWDPQNTKKSIARLRSKSVSYSEIVSASGQFRELARDLREFSGRVWALTRTEHAALPSQPDLTPIDE